MINYFFYGTLCGLSVLLLACPLIIFYCNCCTKKNDEDELDIIKNEEKYEPLLKK
jgi:hypothetical protein